MSDAKPAFVDARPSGVMLAHPGFLFWMSVLLLALVLIDFTPSFYLRPFFDNPIPTFLTNYAHGSIITAWYLWLVVQTSLVRTRRTDAAEWSVQASLRRSALQA